MYCDELGKLCSLWVHSDCRGKLINFIGIIELTSSYGESFCGLSLLKTAKVSPSKVAIVYNVIIISHDHAHLHT